MRLKELFIQIRLLLGAFVKNKFCNTLYYSGMTGFGGNSYNRRKTFPVFLSILRCSAPFKIFVNPTAINITVLRTF